MPGITPCLWFDSQAEEAARFYVSVFSSIRGSSPRSNGSKILNVVRYGDAAAQASGKQAGEAMTVTSQLDAQEFLALSGGPAFRFSEAVSFVVNCESQLEIDQFWTKLCDGGDERAQQCGWLKDKLGLSWQIVPSVLPKLLSDPKRAERVMAALVRMKKIDIAALERA